MRRTRNTVGVALCAALLVTMGVGCVGTRVRFADAPIEKLDLTRGRSVSASGSGFQLLLFIPIAVNGRMERAYDSLLEQAGRDHLTDIKIQESWTYAFVGTVYTTTLTATAYPELTTPGVAPAQNR